MSRPIGPGLAAVEETPVWLEVNHRSAVTWMCTPDQLEEREDIGRHNAVDNVIGGGLMAGRSPAGLGLLVTGRISAEPAFTAARAGITYVATPSGPSTLALAIALALTAAGAGRLAAQTPDQPNLIFSISAGYLTGGHLWSLPRQLALAVSTGNGNVWDSVALARELRPGFAATLSATIFRSPHLGYTAEAGFFGIGTESRCAPLAPFAPTADNQNAQACTYLNGENMRSDAVGFLGGLVWRFTRGGVQPYVRAAGGLAILGSSFVEEATPVFTTGGGTNLVYFLSDQNHKELTWMVSLGAGVMLPLGPGYQLRVEARDVIVPLPYPTGPATDTAGIAGEQALPQPPVGLRTVHLPTLTVGLDVVLERRRGHRY